MEILASATLPDTITFAVAAAICLIGSVGVVVSKNPVHSALMLVMTLFGVAVLFVEENAQFLAAVQVIVYAGAIVVLFLFVIMLLGVDRTESIAADPLKGQRITALLLGALVLVEIILLGRGHWPTGAHSTAGPLNVPGKANVNVLGASLFTTYLIPFEITSALLVIAIIGAVVLARRPRPQQLAPGTDDDASAAGAAPDGSAPGSDDGAPARDGEDDEAGGGAADGAPELSEVTAGASHTRSASGEDGGNLP